jgi:hypothetical protein
LVEFAAYSSRSSPALKIRESSPIRARKPSREYDEMGKRFVERGPFLRPRKSCV